MLDAIPPRLRWFLREMLRFAVALLAGTGAIALLHGDVKVESSVWGCVLAGALGIVARVLSRGVPPELLPLKRPEGAAGVSLGGR